MTEHGLSCFSQPLRMPIGGGNPLIHSTLRTQYSTTAFALHAAIQVAIRPKRQPPIPRIYVSMLNIVYILFARKDTTFFSYIKQNEQNLAYGAQDVLRFGNKYTKNQIKYGQMHIRGEYMGSIRVASKYWESIHMYRLCIGYVSVILHAGREKTGANRRTSARDKQGMSKG